MTDGGSGTVPVDRNEGGAAVPTVGAGQVTSKGGARGELRIAGGAAADTVVAGVGYVTLPGGPVAGAVTLIGSRGANVMATGAGPATFTFGIGHDSLILGGRLEMIHVVGGQAGGVDPISKFRIGVENVHLVDFASTVAAGVAAPMASDASRGSMAQVAGRTRIDMVGIAHLRQSGLA